MTIRTIIARYNEDISWVKHVPNPIIYNKGNDILSGYQSYYLDNIGRESDTYLKFIIHNYYNISNEDLIYLLQGNPFAHCPNLYDTIKDISAKHIRNIEDPENNPPIDDVTELGHIIVNCDINGAPNHPGLNIKKVMTEIFETDDIPSHYRFVAGAQYAIKGKVIRNKSFYWWENVRAIHNDNLTHDRNGSPWIFERIWPLIWEY